MKTMISCLIFLALTINTFGQETLSPGVHFLKVTVNNDGTSSVERINPILLGPTKSQPQPQPQPQPDPTLPERAKLVREAALKLNDPKMAQNLGALYQKLAEQIRAGTLKGQANISLAVKAGTDLLLLQTKTDWTTVRTITTAEFVKLTQQGVDDSAYADYFDEVASGLFYGDPEAIDWELVFQIIKWIIEFINTLQVK